jgi:hypothetical protein
MSTIEPTLRTVNVTRYVTPLREGGSLPAIVEADDGFLYVMKFRGAGQGEKALIAELISGEIARALGFRVPEIVFAELDIAFSRSEPDEEIQDLLIKKIAFEKKYNLEGKEYFNFKKAVNNSEMSNITIMFEEDGIYICQYNSANLWTDIGLLKYYMEGNKINYEIMEY